MKSKYSTIGNRSNHSEHSLFLMFVYVLIFSFHQETLSAQQTNLQYPEPYAKSDASATSILNSTSPNGRIGGTVYNGSISPSSPQLSRFSSDSSVIRGSAGNIIGIDRSSGSRFSFSGNPPFQSKSNYDLLRLRNEMFRLREEKALELNKQFSNQNEPRLVTATAPQRYPYPDRSAKYGRNLKDALSSQNQQPTNAPQGNSFLLSSQNVSTKEFDPAQRIWMRGRSGQVYENHNAIQTNSFGSADNNSLIDYNGYNYARPSYPSNASNGLSGSLSELSGKAPDIWNFPRVRTAEDDYRMFIEYLETQILSDPNVNPLSAIEITYQNRVATIRGVVPTPDARLAAGRILLADPRIDRVNNLLSFVRNDDPEITTPQFQRLGQNAPSPK